MLTYAHEKYYFEIRKINHESYIITDFLIRFLFTKFCGKNIS